MNNTLLASVVSGAAGILLGFALKFLSGVIKGATSGFETQGESIGKTVVEGRSIKVLVGICLFGLVVLVVGKVYLDFMSKPFGTTGKMVFVDLAAGGTDETLYETTVEENASVVPIKLQIPLTIPLRAFDPALASDGRIAVSIGDDGRPGSVPNRYICIIPVNRSTATCLPNGGTDDTQPIWKKPYYDKIAYVSGKRGEDAVIKIVESKDGGNTFSGPKTFVAIPNSQNSSPQWSPDGDVLAFIGGPQDNNNDGYICVVVVPDTIEDSIRECSLKILKGRSYRRLSWSPDGKYIAFTANNNKGGWGIYIWKVDISKIGEGTKELGRTTAEDGITWSKDSRFLAYVCEIGTRKLCWLNVEDTPPTEDQKFDAKQLLPRMDGSRWQVAPNWQP